MEFLVIDEALVRAAAKASGGGAPGKPSRAEMAEWIEELPEAEKDAWLLQLLDDDGDEASVQTALRVRFREANAPQGVSIADNQKRRTVAELFQSVEAFHQEIEREAAEQRAAEEARKAKAEAERRAERRGELAKREPQAWREVDRLIEAKNASAYDQAVSLLEDLLDLADSSGRRDEAIARIREIRARHPHKLAFIKRLDKAFGLK